MIACYTMTAVKHYQVPQSINADVSIQDLLTGLLLTWTVFYYSIPFILLGQDQVSGTTTSTVLKNLQPDTTYTVTLVPVYHEMEGKPLSENGRTS